MDICPNSCSLLSLSVLYNNTLFTYRRLLDSICILSIAYLHSSAIFTQTTSLVSLAFLRIRHFVFVIGPRVGFLNLYWDIHVHLATRCNYFRLVPLSEEQEKDMLFRLNACPKVLRCDPAARRMRRKLMLRKVTKVKPRRTATPLIRSPRYYGHLFFGHLYFLARQNGHTFAYKKSR